LPREATSVSPPDTPATPGETTIDGDGGTLVPGLFEMHAHLSEISALSNVLAGVTSVRDMGSDNASLDRLVRNIDSGVLAGPRVIRAGMIEGKSETNNQNGIVVDSEAAAVEAVRWYAARDYDQAYKTERQAYDLLADGFGPASVYWLTQEYNAPARSLYDTLAHRTSFVVYRR
jgi:imidazolonepropionase-like amidohydrolase